MTSVPPWMPQYMGRSTTKGKVLDYRAIETSNTWYVCPLC